jgi:hypothetical protein
MSDQESKGVPPVPGDRSKSGGSGNSVSAVKRACELAQEAGTKITSELGTELDRPDKLRTVAAFKRTLIPPKRSGRIPSRRITEAHRDWKAGLCGLLLYQKHIPGFDKMNRYTREVKSRRLMDAIRNRERRAANCLRPNPTEGEDTMAK